MKKALWIIIGILLVLVVGAAVLLSVDFNRLGKQAYYTEITKSDHITEDKDASGVVYKTYHYELPAYDKNGTKKMLTFTASKELRSHAFLKLYVKKADRVTSYDEVKQSELPDKVIAKLIN